MSLRGRDSAKLPMCTITVILRRSQNGIYQDAVARGTAVRTDGSNLSRSATNLVSETTKKLDLRRAGFARDFRPLSAVRFRDRRQRRFWAICGPSAPENLEWLFQWCGSLPADSDCRLVDSHNPRVASPASCHSQSLKSPKNSSENRFVNAKDRFGVDSCRSR
jgi:hypothetical protein